jgi:thiamine biosynthesis lipoprotein
MTQHIRHAEHVMGTVFSFDVAIGDGSGEPGARAAIADAASWLRHVEDVFSPYRTDSEISRLNRRELRLGECDPDVSYVLDRCAEIGVASNGYFSSTFAGRLDPTGFVKGWAIQRTSETLRDAGFYNHSVNGGGDVQLAGAPEPYAWWQVGIAHPLHPGEFADVVAIRDGAVATSGTAERGLHIVDPLTGKPASLLASVTVIGPHLAYADAFATAAFAMGAQARSWLESLGGYEALAIASDGSGWATSGWATSSLITSAFR